MARIAKEPESTETAPRETDLFLGVRDVDPNPIQTISEEEAAWFLSDAHSHGPAPALVKAFEQRRKNLARQRNAK